MTSSEEVFDTLHLPSEQAVSGPPEGQLNASGLTNVRSITLGELALKPAPEAGRGPENPRARQLVCHKLYSLLRLFRPVKSVYGPALLLLLAACGGSA